MKLAPEDLINVVTGTLTDRRDVFRLRMWVYNEMKRITDPTRDPLQIVTVDQYFNGVSEMSKWNSVYGTLWMPGYATMRGYSTAIGHEINVIAFVRW